MRIFDFSFIYFNNKIHNAIETGERLKKLKNIFITLQYRTYKSVILITN